MSNAPQAASFPTPTARKDYLALLSGAVGAAGDLVRDVSGQVMGTVAQRQDAAVQRVNQITSGLTSLVGGRAGQAKAGVLSTIDSLQQQIQSRLSQAASYANIVHGQLLPPTGQQPPVISPSGTGTVGAGIQPGVCSPWQHWDNLIQQCVDNSPPSGQSNWAVVCWHGRNGTDPLHASVAQYPFPSNTQVLAGPYPNPAQANLAALALQTKQPSIPLCQSSAVLPPAGIPPPVIPPTQQQCYYWICDSRGDTNIDGPTACTANPGDPWGTDGHVVSGPWPDQATASQHAPTAAEVATYCATLPPPQQQCLPLGCCRSFRLNSDGSWTAELDPDKVPQLVALIGPVIAAAVADTGESESEGFEDIYQYTADFSKVITP